jgi:CHASE1-domain containing sensor protein
MSTASFFKFGLTDNITYGLVDGFESFCQDLLPLNFARALSVAPFITPVLRPAFEAYAVQNAQRMGGDTSSLLPQIQQGIFFRRNGTNTPYPANANISFFLPVWQISPMGTNQAAILFDLNSEPNRNQAIALAVATREPATTDIIQLVQDTTAGMQRASGLVFVPFYPRHEPSARLPMALASVVFSWDDIFAQSLRGTSGVDIVLVLSSLRRKYTFSHVNGVTFNIGPGDLSAQLVAADLRQYYHSVNTTLGLRWTVELYPTAAMRGVYVTSLPRNITIAVVMAIVAVAAVFFLYDYLARGRLHILSRVVRSATRVLEEMNVVPKAYNFQEEVELMTKLNTNAGRAETGVLLPRELSRATIRSSPADFIGAGAFGRVYKVYCRLSGFDDLRLS